MHSRRNVSSSEYNTEDRQSLANDDNRSSVNRESAQDPSKDNFSSNSKVNFDIFKNTTKVYSIDVSSYKNASTADKLVIEKYNIFILQEAIKKSHEKLLGTDKSSDKTEKTEKYEKTRENFMKKLNQLRKDPKDAKDSKDAKDAKTEQK